MHENATIVQIRSNVPSFHVNRSQKVRDWKNQTEKIIWLCLSIYTESDVKADINFIFRDVMTNSAADSFLFIIKIVIKSQR